MLNRLLVISEANMEIQEMWLRSPDVNAAYLAE